MSEKIPVYQESSPSKIQTQCDTCTRKLCCVVFDIVNTKGQGREEESIKEGGLPCPHLNNGQCQIYADRHKHPGFRQNCETYDCRGAGPVISSWADTNGFDIYEHSKEIGVMLIEFQDPEKHAELIQITRTISDPKTYYWKKHTSQISTPPHSGLKKFLFLWLGR